MLFKGLLITAGSGRLGDVVFSHNRGGPYIRAWVQPDETATTERQAVWDAMAAIGARWPTLSSLNRSKWHRFSIEHPRHNRIGVARPVGGFQEFTRANFYPQQANNLLGYSFPWRDAPPAGTTPQPTAAPTLSISTISGTKYLDVDIPTGKGYSTSVNAALCVYVSDAQPGTVFQSPGPYTLTEAIQTPGTGGVFTCNLPSQPTSGQCILVRFRYFDQPGTVGPKFRARVVAP